MQSLKEIYGPVAVITGASSGIGESYARLLAEQGFNLLLTARRGERLQQLGEALMTQHAVQVQTVVANLGEEVGVAQIAAAADGMDIGLLVNNAGYRIRKPFVDLERHELDAMIETNALGHARLTRRLLPQLLRRRRSGLLFTGSIEATMGFPNSAAYAASKAFIRSLGEGLFGELRHRGVDVLVVEPGSTDTENLARQPDGDSAAALSPEEVARFGLAHLDQGPVLVVANDTEREAVAGLAAMPRDEALTMMGQQG